MGIPKFFMLKFFVCFIWALKAVWKARNLDSARSMHHRVWKLSKTQRGIKTDGFQKWQGFFWFKTGHFGTRLFRCPFGCQVFCGNLFDKEALPCFRISVLRVLGSQNLSQTKNIKNPSCTPAPLARSIFIGRRYSEKRLIRLTF